MEDPGLESVPSHRNHRHCEATWSCRDLGCRDLGPLGEILACRAPLGMLGILWLAETPPVMSVRMSVGLGWRSGTFCRVSYATVPVLQA